MSLHIGRLSSHVRQGYLEHLFQAFGRCTVKLKNGYGFAVFDSSDDAARALRELHGKPVCGERITVNWSKHQPKFSLSSRRSSRFIESSHGRRSKDGVGSLRFSEPADQKNHHTSNATSCNPDGAAEKRSDQNAEGLEDVGDDEDPGEMKMGDGGTSDANAIEHDRWGDAGKGNHGEDGDDFDRFEPYHGYGKKEEKEKIGKADHGHFSEVWQNHPVEHFDLNHDKPKYCPTCYNCGSAGHVTRNCSEEAVGKFKTLRGGLILKEKQKPGPRRFGSPLKRRPEFHVDPMIQAHHRVQDNRKPVSDGTGRAPRLSDVSRLNRRHTPYSQNVPNVPKEAQIGNIGNKSKRSHEPSLSSDRSSAYSRSRSSCSHSRAQSPSHSANYSSKSSQPIQPEGLKLRSISNISYPGPLSVSVSPQCDSLPAAGNKNLDFLVNSTLGSNLDSKTRSEFKVKDDYKQEAEGSRSNNEVPVTSSKLNTLSNGELPVPGKDVKVAGHTEANLHKGVVDDDIVGNRVPGQKTNPGYTSSVKKPNKENLAKSGRDISLKLTMNEVVSALKHYGMEAREIGLLNQPVEKFFGAARLWPWEIIYYRRRKKGPISIENYAKRVEQNKEFGIVDQYVRSSSGWWECH